MRNHRSKIRNAVLTSIVSVAIVFPASAQESAAVQSSESQQADSREGSQDIVVTATKRAESIQDVPLSISVVTAEDISKRGLVSAEDYLRGIPGVNQTSDPVGSTIIIRGLEASPSFQNFSSGATVATYFGETPITNSAGLAANTNVDIKLVDMERVEVLRGPQGTAFGNSSLGGAVRQIPKAPELGEFEGHLGGGYSRTAGYGGDNYMLQGAVNVPVGDIIALRATAYRFSDSGIYRNNASTDPDLQEAAELYGAEAYANDYSNVGSSTFDGARISALIKPSDSLSLNLMYLTQKTEVDGLPLANSGRFTQASFETAPEHLIRGQRNSASDMKIDLFNAVLEYKLDWGSFLATYSRIDSRAANSGSYSQYAPIWPLSFIQTGDHSEDSGEIRFASDFSGRFNFLVGVYAEKLRDDALFDYRYQGTRADTALFSEEFVGLYLDKRSLTQKAVFGEASYEIVDGLTATVGGRYYDYSRNVSTFSTGELFGGDSSDTNQAKSNGTTFRGNLSWAPNKDFLVYGSWSEGFRLGKPQPGLPAGVCDVNNDGIIDGSNITIESTKSLDSDTVKSYEIGSKFSLLQNRVTGSAAIFLMDWNGVPFRTAAPEAPTGCGLTYNANAGKARTKGAEFQVSVALTDALRADFGGSYLDAKLTEDAPALGAVAGDRLPGSPKVNANLSLQYDFAIGGREAFIRADSIYIGPFYGDVYQSAATRAGDYIKIDLTGRVTFGKVGLDLFVQNLTNQDAYTFRGTSDVGREFVGYRMRPRTVGARLSYDF